MAIKDRLGIDKTTEELEAVFREIMGDLADRTGTSSSDGAASAAPAAQVAEGAASAARAAHGGGGGIPADAPLKAGVGSEHADAAAPAAPSTADPSSTFGTCTAAAAELTDVPEPPAELCVDFAGFVKIVENFKNAETYKPREPGGQPLAAQPLLPPP